MTYECRLSKLLVDSKISSAHAHIKGPAQAKRKCIND